MGDNLKSFQQRIGKYFARSEAKGQPLTIFCFAPWNGKTEAEQVGYASPYRLQHLLGRAIWDEEQMCAEVRDYVVEHLDDGAGIWPWTKPASLRGRRISWGGETLWSDGAEARTVKLECFSPFISSKGQSLIDRRLYLPVLDHS